MIGHSCEKLGFYSVVDGQCADPIFSTLNVDELKRINQEGISVRDAECIQISRKKDTINHLLEFLEKKDIFNHNLDENEFNVVGLAGTMRNLIASNKFHTNESKMHFYGHSHENTIILEEFTESEVRLATKTEMIEFMLATMPDEFEERSFTTSSLFVVAKHRYSYVNGIVINLFVSKEVHSVMKHGDDIIPIELKCRPFYCLATVKLIDNLLWGNPIMDFLTGGLCQVIPIETSKEPGVVRRVFIIDDISRLCESKALKNFKTVLRKFLLQFIKLKEGTIIKYPVEGNSLQNIKIVYGPNMDKTHSFKAAAMQYFLPLRKKVFNYEPSEREIVIIGTYKGTLPYYNHTYNADFVTLKRFCEGRFSDVLLETNPIEFYGTEEEYEQLHCYLNKDQLATLSFVEYVAE